MRKDLGQQTQIEKKETHCERKKISAAHLSSGCLAECGDRDMAKSAKPSVCFWLPQEQNSL